jgi:hypothetical protein
MKKVDAIQINLMILMILLSTYTILSIAQLILVMAGTI